MTEAPEQELEQKPRPDPSTRFGVDRRTVIKAAGVAFAGPAIPGMTGEQIVRLGVETHEAAHSSRTAAARNQRAATKGVLSESQRELLELVTETLLPRTETPGANDAGVVGFIDTMLEGWFPEDGRKQYLAELNRFAAAAEERYSKSFAECDTAQRSELVAASEKSAIEARAGKSFSPSAEDLFSASFFDVTKWLTVYGYFTSEVVLRDTLGYRIVPGRYDGAVEIRTD